MCAVAVERKLVRRRESFWLSNINTRPEVEVNQPGKSTEGTEVAAVRLLHQYALRDAVRTRVSAGHLWPAVRLLLLLPSGPRHPAYRRVLRHKEPLRGGESAPAARRLLSEPLRPESSGQRAMLPGPPQCPHQTRQPLPDREKHPQNPELERAGSQGVVRRVRGLAAGHPEPLGELVH